MMTAQILSFLLAILMLFRARGKNQHLLIGQSGRKIKGCLGVFAFVLFSFLLSQH